MTTPFSVSDSGPFDDTGSETGPRTAGEDVGGPVSPWTSDDILDGDWAPLRPFLRLAENGFDADAALKLARAGYDILGYIRLSDLPSGWSVEAIR
jgi:hypothetical protein